MTGRRCVLRRLRSPARDAADLAAVLRNPAIGRFEVEEVVDRRQFEVTPIVTGPRRAGEVLAWVVREMDLSSPPSGPPSTW